MLNPFMDQSIEHEHHWVILDRSNYSQTRVDMSLLEYVEHFELYCLDCKVKKIHSVRII